MTSHFHRPGRSAIVALALVAAGAACRPDRATVFEPAGASSYDFRIVVPAAADARLPGGTVAVTKINTAGTTGTMRVSIANLEPLTSGEYKLWIGKATDADVTNVVPLTGTLSVITSHPDGEGGVASVDTVITTGQSSFTGGGTAQRYVLNVNNASLGSDPASSTRNVVFMSVESAAGATTPSTIQPLYAIYTLPTFAATDAAGSSKTTTTTFTFGSFAPAKADRYAYFLNGHGKGGVRGSTVIADDSALARPPKGYYYAAFLVGPDVGAGEKGDTIYAGELTAPYPRRGVSLRDADISTPDMVVQVQPPLLTAAAIRADASTLGLSGPLPYEGLDRFRITLKLKTQVDPKGLPPNEVAGATLPGAVTTPPATP